MGHVNSLRKNSKENGIHLHFVKYDIRVDIASCKYKNIEFSMPISL